jgi:hypothetical protein
MSKIVLTDTWRPDPTETALAQEAYLEYVTGIAILSDPKSLTSIHRMDVEPENIEPIVVHSEALMVNGLRTLLQYSNPEESRTGLKMAERFLVTIPNILRIVNSCYTKNERRFRELNPALFAVRPIALRDQTTHLNVARGKYGRLRTGQLMDGFRPSPILVDTIKNRKIVYSTITDQ